MPATIVMQFRRGTASAWTTANTVLHAGEFGVETDTGMFKIGDGTTAWTSLGYAAIQTSAGDTRYVLASAKGAASGVATLDSGGHIPSAQLPALRIVSVQTAANQAARLALATNDDATICYQTDTAQTYILPANTSPATNGNWTDITPNLTGLQATSAKDAASGYAGLDASGLLKVAEFPVLDGGSP